MNLHPEARLLAYGVPHAFFPYLDDIIIKLNIVLLIPKVLTFYRVAYVLMDILKA